MLLENCFKDFFIYLEIEKGISPSTLAGYKYDLGVFLLFLKEINLSPQAENIRVHHLREFLIYLKRERLNSPVTINRKVSTLKSLFKYLYEEGNYGVDKNMAALLPKLKTGKRLPQVLTLEECRQFLVNLKKASPFPRRDYAMFLFFLQTGCRLKELKELKLSSIHLEEGYATLWGKGNKERYVPLTPETCWALREYLEIRNPALKDNSFLFISMRGRPLSRRGIQAIFKTLAEKTGIYRPGLSVHKLRHTCLTLLLKEGVDIRSLQEIAGHADIATTQIYTHVVQEDIREKLKVHPLAKIDGGSIIKEPPGSYFGFPSIVS